MGVTTCRTTGRSSVGPAAKVWLATLAALAMLAAGCSGSLRLDRSMLPSLLGPEVDSAVVRTFETAPRVQINAADLALFRKHLRAALDASDRVRTFEEAPTLLANTVVLAGRLERVEVNERRGDGLYLRTIELTATLDVLPAEAARNRAQAAAAAGGSNGAQPLATVRRELAWQKVYPGGPVSGLALDLEDAVRELTGELAAALVIPPDEQALPLRSGRDPDSLTGRAHPALVNGNSLAMAGLLERAALAWRAVLFDPVPAGEARTYRVSELTLNRLRVSGVGPDVLERLRPLVGEEAQTLVPFRNRLREALGETVENEGLILTLADVHTARTHRTMAAAHENLGSLYALEHRNDLVAYHWARAWAHDPDPALLERWRALQAERKVLPRNLTDEAAMALYLRIPPPGSAGLTPGRFERTVLPPPAFPEDEAAVEVAAGASGSATQSAAPAPQEATGTAVGGGQDDQTQPAPALQPVALPPPDAPAGEDSTTPGRAAGGGPSGTGEAAATPEAPPPAPEAAPAAR